MHRRHQQRLLRVVRPFSSFLVESAVDGLYTYGPDPLLLLRVGVVRNRRQGASSCRRRPALRSEHTIAAFLPRSNTARAIAPAVPTRSCHWGRRSPESAPGRLILSTASCSTVRTHDCRILAALEYCSSYRPYGLLVPRRKRCQRPLHARSRPAPASSSAL